MKSKISIIFSFVTFILVTLMASCNSNSDELNVDQNILQEQDNGIVLLNSGASVEYKDGRYFWENDIILSETQLKVLDQTGDIVEKFPEIPDNSTITLTSPQTGRLHILNEAKTRSTAIYPTPYNLWAMVRFVYAPNGFANETQLNHNLKHRIIEALNYWQTHTNVRFYNATGQPTTDPDWGFAYPYVFICNGDNNASSVGRIDGKQLLTLRWDCSVGNIIHEIGHAIGLLHEHTRYDRDDHIIVNMNNIQPDRRGNFTKRTSNYHCIGSIDFESIMMYPSFTGFEIDPAIPSMRKRSDNSTFEAQRTHLTDLDRRFPNTFYLPYIARRDVYRELDNVVYDQNNRQLTPSERLQLQSQLNNGNPTPPADGRIPNSFE